MSLRENANSPSGPASVDPSAALSRMPFPLQDHQIATASNDDIVAACENAPDLCEDGSRLKRISGNAVVKLSTLITPHEARNMQFVAANTSVRLPHVMRCFEITISQFEKKTYIVMEYIHGQVLADCWDGLSENAVKMFVSRS